MALGPSNLFLEEAAEVKAFQEKKKAPWDRGFLAPLILGWGSGVFQSPTPREAFEQSRGRAGRP